MRFSEVLGSAHLTHRPRCAPRAQFVFEPNEAASAAKVCLIGATVAKQLFGGSDPVDQSIRIKRVPFTVIGLLETKGQSLMGTDQDDVILMPISTARTRVIGSASAAKQRSVGTIWVKAADGIDASLVEAQVRALLRQRHRLQPGADDDFSLRNLAEVMAAQEASSRVLALLLDLAADEQAIRALEIDDWPRSGLPSRHPRLWWTASTGRPQRSTPRARPPSPSATPTIAAPVRFE